MRHARFSYGLTIDDANDKSTETVTAQGSFDTQGAVTAVAAAQALGRALKSLEGRLTDAPAADVVAAFTKGYGDQT